MCCSLLILNYMHRPLEACQTWRLHRARNGALPPSQQRHQRQHHCLQSMRADWPRARQRTRPAESHPGFLAATLHAKSKHRCSHVSNMSHAMSGI
jgi:hypothetical protein